MTTRTRIGLWALTAAMILTANDIGHSGTLNWAGLLSYMAGFIGGAATFIPQSPEAKNRT